MKHFNEIHCKMLSTQREALEAKEEFMHATKQSFPNDKMIAMRAHRYIELANRVTLLKWILNIR